MIYEKIFSWKENWAARKLNLTPLSRDSSYREKGSVKSFIDKRKKMSDKRNLIAVIGDEDTTTGLLLAGVGQVTQSTQEKNFFVYQESKTSREEISDAFENFTRERSDIAILLINQHVAEKIRSQVDGFTDAFPAILEIPSKEHPYNPEKDSVLRRVRRLFGE